MGGSVLGVLCSHPESGRALDLAPHRSHARSLQDVPSYSPRSDYAKKNLTSTGLEPATPRWLPSKDRGSKSGTLSIAPTGSHQPESTILQDSKPRPHARCLAADSRLFGWSSEARCGKHKNKAIPMIILEFYTGGSTIQTRSYCPRDVGAKFPGHPIFVAALLMHFRTWGDAPEPP